VTTDRDLHDPALDAAWRDHSRETPPASLDAAILAAAHRAVGSAPRTAEKRGFAPSWRSWWPLAVAATLGAIAFGIVELAPTERDPTTAIVSDVPKRLDTGERAPAAREPASSAGAPRAPAPAAEPSAAMRANEAMKETQPSPPIVAPSAPAKNKDAGPSGKLSSGSAPGASSARTSDAKMPSPPASTIESKGPIESKPVPGDANRRGTFAQSPQYENLARDERSTATNEKGTTAPKPKTEANRSDAASPPQNAPAARRAELAAKAEPADKVSAAPEPFPAQRPAGRKDDSAATRESDSALEKKQAPLANAPENAQKLVSPQSGSPERAEAQREMREETSRARVAANSPSVPAPPPARPATAPASTPPPQAASPAPPAAPAASSTTIAHPQAPARGVAQSAGTIVSESDRERQAAAGAAGLSSSPTSTRDQLEARRKGATQADRDVSDFISRLRAQRAAGHDEEAVQTLRAFRAAHPDADQLLPADLRTWAATIPR